MLAASERYTPLLWLPKIRELASQFDLVRAPDAMTASEVASKCATTMACFLVDSVQRKTICPIVRQL